MRVHSGAKETHQKPYAGRWYTPGATGAPALQNGFAQPADPLQDLAYRWNMDGRHQFQGILNVASATSGTVAWVMPDAVGAQPSYRPDKDEVYPIIVTADAGTTYIVARAHLDSANGDVTIYFEPQEEGGPSSTYHRISTTGTNADTVKASAGEVTGYYITNAASAFRYVKLFNKASNPTVGTDVPVVVLGIQPLTAANIGFENPLEFPTGIALCMVIGIADTDTTQVNINEMAACIFYR